MNATEAVKNYQCPGCVSGPFPECFVKSSCSEGCEKHSPGTYITGIGNVLLGLPKGFKRLGESKRLMVNIFDNLDGFREVWGDDGYDKLNVPVWKHLDENGNTIVRAYLPRVNVTTIHIFLCNEIDNIDCIEVTNDDLDGWD
jgi:hypothetical protein